MREFMHHITNTFFSLTGWSEDNTYKDLNATSRGMCMHLPKLGCAR